MGAGQSTPKITAQDRAILSLKLQRDKLKQYQKSIIGILDREQQVAKQCLAAGQKERALLALRRRKFQQSLLDRTYSQLENLEQLVTTIEFSLIEQSVLLGLKQGNDVLAQIHKEMSIESVDKLLSETKEAQEYQREISDMLANNITFEEEEAVQQELLELEQQELEKSQVPVHLPNAPDHVPGVREGDKEPILAEPEAEEEPQRVLIPAS